MYLQGSSTADEFQRWPNHLCEVHHAIVMHVGLVLVVGANEADLQVPFAYHPARIVLLRQIPANHKVLIHLQMILAQYQARILPEVAQLQIGLGHLLQYSAPVLQGERERVRVAVRVTTDRIND